MTLLNSLHRVHLVRWNLKLALFATATLFIHLLIYSSFGQNAALIGTLRYVPSLNIFFEVYSDHSRTALLDGQPSTGRGHNTHSTDQGEKDNFIQVALRSMFRDSLPITAERFVSPTGKVYSLKDQPRFTESLGKDLLILDVETRPLHGNGQILNGRPLNLDDATFDTMSRLDHYMYGKNVRLFPIK
jgi:hypothetical protein